MNITVKSHERHGIYEVTGNCTTVIVQLFVQSNSNANIIMAFVRWPLHSPHKGPLVWKEFPCYDVIMISRIFLQGS